MVAINYSRTLHSIQLHPVLVDYSAALTADAGGSSQRIYCGMISTRAGQPAQGAGYGKR